MSIRNTVLALTLSTFTLGAFAAINHNFASSIWYPDSKKVGPPSNDAKVLFLSEFANCKDKQSITIRMPSPKQWVDHNYNLNDLYFDGSFILDPSSDGKTLTTPCTVSNDNIYIEKIVIDSKKHGYLEFMLYSGFTKHDIKSGEVVRDKGMCTFKGGLNTLNSDRQPRVMKLIQPILEVKGNLKSERELNSVCNKGHFLQSSDTKGVFLSEVTKRGKNRPIHLYTEHEMHVYHVKNLYYDGSFILGLSGGDGRDFTAPCILSNDHDNIHITIHWANYGTPAQLTLDSGFTNNDIESGEVVRDKGMCTFKGGLNTLNSDRQPRVMKFIKWNTQEKIE